MRKISEPVPDGFYEARGIRLYHSNFNLLWPLELDIVPDVIFDVGSYDCGDGIRFKLMFPQARVFSFEADPVRFEIARRNASQFNVTVTNAAAIDRDGLVKWYEVRDHFIDEGNIGSQGSIYLHSDRLNAKLPYLSQSRSPSSVNGIRMDTFCNQYGIQEICIAHIDVQGAEHDVICGLGLLRPKLIYVEMPSDEDVRWIGAKEPKEVHSLLRGLDYFMFGDFGGDRLYVHKSVADGPSWTLPGAPKG
jgi:FkbM family methyltransferase